MEVLADLTPSSWRGVDSDALLRNGVSIGGAPASVAGLLCAHIAERNDRCVFVVAPSEADALLLRQAASLLLDEPLVQFPAPGLSPFQEAEPALHLRAMEVTSYRALLEGEAAGAVLTPRAIFRRFPDPDEFLESIIGLEAGREMPLEKLAGELVALGYLRTENVTEVGTFAVRGGVFDVFGPGAEGPVRLDMFGDDIEEICFFDPLTQRSAGACESIDLLPMGLWPGDPQLQGDLSEVLQESAEVMGGEALQRLEELDEGLGFPGWQNYLPLLDASSSAIWELFDDAWLAVYDRQLVAREVTHHIELLHQEAEARRESGRLVVDPDAVLVPGEEVVQALDAAETNFEVDPAAAVSVRLGGSETDSLMGQPGSASEGSGNVCGARRAFLGGGAE